MKNTTLVTQEVMAANAAREGIDPRQISVIYPRWAESAPWEQGVKSALITCDLIIRDDGPFVVLDGAMGMDSMMIADAHSGRADRYRKHYISLFPEVLVASTSTMEEIRQEAIKAVGWETYVKRLRG